MAQFNPAVLIPEIGAYDLCNPYCNMNHLASIIFTQRNTLFYIQVKDNSERNYASTGTARCAAALSYMGVVLVSFIDKIHRLSHFSSIFQFHSPKHLYLLPSEFRRASQYYTIVSQRPWFATLVVFCFIGANTRTLDRHAYVQDPSPSKTIQGDHRSTLLTGMLFLFSSLLSYSAVV